MAYSEVCKAVETLKKKYDTTDPFHLCREMGIRLLTQPLGGSQDAIKGFFVEMNRIKMIVVNGDLPLVLQRIITAHEIGHAVMHCHTGLREFHDVCVFDESSVLEKDANLFAAELLLDDRSVMTTLNADTTFFTAAASLRVPVELLDFKFRVMKWKGCKMVEPPVTARNNFLRDLEVPVNASDD